MARAVLITDCRPLTPDDITKAGHEAVSLRTVEETWDYIFPNPNVLTEFHGLGTEVAVLGADLPAAIREELVEWMEEETDLLPVLVLTDANMPERSGYGHYMVSDSATDALDVVVRLLNGVDRNC